MPYISIALTALLLFTAMDSSEWTIATIPVPCSLASYTFPYIIDAEL
jgi:hypothetical protein